MTLHAPQPLKSLERERLSVEALHNLVPLIRKPGISSGHFLFPPYNENGAGIAVSHVNGDAAYATMPSPMLTQVM